MYNDDYVNNFGSSGETPPEDNSADTAQQSAPLEPDQIYSAHSSPSRAAITARIHIIPAATRRLSPRKRRKR